MLPQSAPLSATTHVVTPATMIRSIGARPIRGPCHRLTAAQTGSFATSRTFDRMALPLVHHAVSVGCKASSTLSLVKASRSAPSHRWWKVSDSPKETRHNHMDFDAKKPTNGICRTLGWGASIGHSYDTGYRLQIVCAVQENLGLS